MTTLAEVDGIQLHTAPAVQRRLGAYQINISAASIIASREVDPCGGVFVYPTLWHGGDDLYLNWHFDRDMLDGHQADRPNGRVSRDGGRTWQPQKQLSPPGHKAQTGPTEITSFWHAFEIPGEPGRYRVATWRSADSGRSWGDMTWTHFAYPGTRGLDIYHPPDGYKKHSANYKGGVQRAQPPPYMEPLFAQAGTRRRGPPVYTICKDLDDALLALTPARWLPGGEHINDEQTFWNQLDWSRNAILLQRSTDGGRTWTFGGSIAHDAQHEITEFDEESCFAEPTMAIYPDGYRVCILRTGSFRTLYLVSSADGKAWSKPRPLPIRGVKPELALRHGNVLVLATGRPDCTVYFSLDRGATWPVHEVFFTPDKRMRKLENVYNHSTCNAALAAIDDDTLLYVHDVSRYDPHGADDWLQRAGHARVLGRHITVRRSARAAGASLLADCFRPLTRIWAAPATDIFTRPAPDISAAVRDPADLVLDGQVDDRFWQKLPAHALAELETGGRVTADTSFRVAWAQNALYFAIHCAEPDMARLHRELASEDPNAFWKGDTIELLLRTQVHSYYQIVINPQARIINIDRQNGLNFQWSSNAQAAVALGRSHWTLEVRLPLAAVNPAADRTSDGIVGRLPTRDDPWFVNVCRQRPLGTAAEISALCPTGEVGFHQRLKFANVFVV